MIRNVPNRSVDEIWLGKTKPNKGKTRDKSKTEFRGKCPQDGGCKRVFFLLVDLANLISILKRVNGLLGCLPERQDLSSLS